MAMGLDGCGSVRGHAQVGQGAGSTRGVALLTFPAQAEPVVALFERIAAREGWQPGGELRAYGGRSAYFALEVPTELTGKVARIVGGLQLVSPDAAGRLPCHKVWPELPIPMLSAVHILVLAAEAAEAQAAEAVSVEGARKGRPAAAAGEPSPFWLLCAAMWHHCVEQGIRDLWLEATPKMLRCYRLLGWPLVVRGELREHWGEPCYPCSLSVREVAGSLAEKAARSRLYRQVLADMVGIRVVDG